ncbi:ABC transporter [Virgibacillus pantothenticus]|uniref:ABC transporter ATP-binding protein n=1 Tax=Virgibacillus pantothenticus TaxID=1473 RepID=UPI001B09AB65|nr:ABC transporter ATP-binding protein [Virgibacillus pantothenticus]MBU8566155.1 ABC transporter ATP-binding protein [Virgibacillus pantothenticus]MBU8600549.1 ABC transporter ATP-binding protein [Virgibacillus pantothenticus]MBU8634475.1 ABC transporter ATP-binding protein [Virgibacillus pantothenticus]MBU8642688.1 ABC transporter ATP-binding protein [Virgibacillus pantothenticus]MBU8647102.1 ABC transporter ATP-binding protein [Virgibacillus pantothenticus]
MKAIEIKKLSKKLDTFHIDRINFTVPKGNIVGLIGENGAGKTTTIKLMMDVIERDSGEVLFFGKPLNKDLKEEISVVYDEINFYEKVDVVKINTILKHIFKAWDSTKYFDLIDRFKLPKNKTIGNFSKGMKMKLNIIIGLAHSPKLLILDEPTSGLDPSARMEMLDLFLEFIQNEEHSILLSSHITNDLERIADYIVMMHNGRIILQLNKDELLYRYGIIRCSEKQFQHIPKHVIFAYQISNSIYEVVINNAPEMKEAYPELTIDRITIDDMMSIYIRGEK